MDRGFQVVDIVASEDICEEDCVEFGLLELLSDSNPMLDVVVLGAFVGGVFEEAGIEMARRLHSKGIDDELFLRRRHD